MIQGSFMHTALPINFAQEVMMILYSYMYCFSYYLEFKAGRETSRYDFLLTSALLSLLQYWRLCLLLETVVYCTKVLLVVTYFIDI